MCQSAQQLYSGNTGMVNITTANPNLDGTGAMGKVIKAINDGLVIKSVTLKCTQSNDIGMIRLFVSDGTNTFLWREVRIPANIQSATNLAYQTTIRTNLVLQNGFELWASTENSESWNVIGEGVNWENCPCPRQ